jgi:uncharacterized membrane protein YgcG
MEQNPDSREVPARPVETTNEPVDTVALADASGGGIIEWIRDLFTEDCGGCGGGGSFGGGGASGSW